MSMISLFCAWVCVFAKLCCVCSFSSEQEELEEDEEEQRSRREPRVLLRIDVLMGPTVISPPECKVPRYCLHTKTIKSKAVNVLEELSYDLVF